jgi:hypothetical protein
LALGGLIQLTLSFTKDAPGESRAGLARLACPTLRNPL